MYITYIPGLIINMLKIVKKLKVTIALYVSTFKQDYLTSYKPSIFPIEKYKNRYKAKKCKSVYLLRNFKRRFLIIKKVK